MRRIFVLLLILTPTCLAVAGCSSKPSPQDRPDFVDTSTNPDAAVDALSADRPGGAPPAKP